MNAADQRRRMVDRQLRDRGVADERVLDAMGRVPREQFVDPGSTRHAYDDNALPIGLLARRVVTIERHEELARAARERLERLGYDNVEVRVGDGSLGAADAAPFDAIVVTAVAPEVPAPLGDQLALGGTLVLPLERRYGHQQLMSVTRVAPDEFEERALLGVAFVPLIGEHGYPKSGRRRAP